MRNLVTQPKTRISAIPGPYAWGRQPRPVPDLVAAMDEEGRSRQTAASRRSGSRPRRPESTFADVDRQHLYRIKYQQADPDTLDEEVTAATQREPMTTGT